MAWLSPNLEAGTVYRSLAIPAPFIAHVSGALIDLCERWNWEQFGDMSVDDCVTAMKAMVDGYYEGSGMIGVCVPYATTTIPGDMLPCDGAVYNRVDYPSLYDALSAAYRIDANTFATPDLRDRFVLGAEEAEGIEGGSDSVTLTVDEIPSHSHVYTEKNEILFPYGAFTPDISARGTLFESNKDTSSVGGGLAHNNMPPWHALPWGIIWR
jgi:microcystin-dependent protein